MTLFAVAVNDLVTSVNNTIGRCLYVDDLAIFFSENWTDKIESTVYISVDLENYIGNYKSH